MKLIDSSDFILVFSKELHRERRAYLHIVIKPIVLITLLMWACLPV